MITSSRGSLDRGSATVEFALTLPAVVVLIAAVLAGARYATDAAVAREAAATAARVALVDGEAAGELAGKAVSPGHLRVSVTASEGWWVANVVLERPGLLPDAIATARALQP